MSIKRFEGGNYLDTRECFRYDGYNWINANSVKRFDGYNWIDTSASYTEFEYSELSSSNVMYFAMMHHDSEKSISWELGMFNSNYYTYVYLVAKDLVLSRGDVVTFRARNVYLESNGVTVKVQSSNSDSNAVTLGSDFREYTFTAPTSGGYPCFKITRAYNGALTPLGILEVDYIRVNGKTYRATFLEGGYYDGE